MHKLKVEGRKIFLDGVELQSVISYQLSDESGGAAEVTIKLLVGEVSVAAHKEQPINHLSLKIEDEGIAIKAINQIARPESHQRYGR